MEEARSAPAAVARPLFAALARQALEKAVPASREPQAHWGVKPNLAWVRWPRPAGGFVYVALRRHLDWVTGEIGVSRRPMELNDLELRAVPDPSPDAGYRVRLGHLLHDEDKWWRARGSQRAVEERIGWIALQMGVKLESFLRQTG